MDPSTSSAQSAASFFYYSPEAQQLRQKQHGQFFSHQLQHHHHQVQAHALASSSPQLLAPTPISPVPFPSQLIFGAANSRSLASGLIITPSASPFQKYRSNSEITMPDTPRLSIDSSASDVLFTPATPPLSLCSTNTPTMSHTLLTPIGEHGWSLEEPSCGTISPMEIQLPGTPLDWRAASPEMLVYGHPVVVPSNASPAPAADSKPTTEADYCDPRTLTYPSPAAIDTEFGLEFPSMPTLAGADDEHRLLLGNELMAFKTEDKTFQAYGFDFMDELSDLDDEEDFINGLTTMSDVVSPTNCLGSKRAKLEVFDESEAFSSDDDSDQLLSPPVSTSTSRQCSETPADSQSSKPRRKMQKKYDSDDYSDCELSEEQRIRSFKFCSRDSEARSDDGKPSGVAINPNVIRRGRKQSLTEDPTKTFVCHLCGRRFRRQEHLKRHFRSLHTEDKPFSCGECGKKFSRSDNLTQHARIHGSGAILLGVLDENDMIERQFGLSDEDSQPLGIVVIDALQAASGSSIKDTIDCSEEKRQRRKRKRNDE